MKDVEQDNLNQLRQNLNTYFGLDDIRSLCFDLGIDYENLPATKEGAVRELIRAVIRNQRLNVLIEQCTELRPQIAWPQFTTSGTAVLPRSHVSVVQLSRREQQERQKKLVLLDKVKKFWIRGVLEHLVPDDKLMALGRRVSTELIDHPWHDVVDATVYDAYTMDVNMGILDIFIETNHALLILGEPGAGKTTTLLELARELITLTEQDATRPIPVVLNLSSWAERRDSIAEWAVEELSNKYHIPRNTSRPWLQNDSLLLLLDGLDEVPDKHRTACVNSINQFRTEQGLTGLVVSSRTYEYEAIGTKLKLDGAVLLQSLTQEQIDSYLATFGSHLLDLRRAIQQSPILGKMAQSPLMLKVMSVAYEHIDEVDNGDGTSLVPDSVTLQGQQEKNFADYQQHLFETYVRRMLHRQDSPPYTAKQTKQWLSWLAQRMTEHNQTIFLIEQMQPSWFVSRSWRWLYLFSARVTAGFFVGLLMWLIIQMGEQVDPEFSVEMIRYFSRFLRLPSAYAEPIVLLVLLMTLGMLVAGIDGWYFEQNTDHQSSVSKKRNWQRVATVSSTITLMIFFTMLIFDPLYLAAFSGLTGGIMFGISSIFADGESFADEVTTTEALSWSWLNSLKGIAVGFIPGMMLGWIISKGINFNENWLIYAYLPSLILTTMLLGGLQKNKVETKTNFNQGIRLSARNAVLTVPLFGIPNGIVFGFTFDITTSLIWGTILALMAGLLYGGAHIMKHFGLRLVLWYKRFIPINYAEFLNYASRNVLLHKVGGGYVFIHRLLQEYFAMLDINSSK